MEFYGWNLRFQHLFQALAEVASHCCAAIVELRCSLCGSPKPAEMRFSPYWVMASHGMKKFLWSKMVFVWHKMVWEIPSRSIVTDFYWMIFFEMKAFADRSGGYDFGKDTWGCLEKVVPFKEWWMDVNGIGDHWWLRWLFYSLILCHSLILLYSLDNVRRYFLAFLRLNKHLSFWFSLMGSYQLNTLAEPVLTNHVLVILKYAVGWLQESQEVVVKHHVCLVTPSLSMPQKPLVFTNHLAVPARRSRGAAPSDATAADWLGVGSKTSKHSNWWP